MGCHRGKQEEWVATRTKKKFDPKKHRLVGKTRIDDPALELVWLEYKERGGEHLRNRLIERYLPLVRYIAERILVKLPQNVELDDLYSAGIFGLMDAVDGYDLERGVKFETYCTTRIRGSILDELRSQDWVPRLVRLKAHRLERAYRSLEGRPNIPDGGVAQFIKPQHSLIFMACPGESHSSTMWGSSGNRQSGP